MSDMDMYTYQVVFSPEDGEYVGTAVEFGPGLSHLDVEPEAALAGIRELVAGVVEDMRAAGETVPAPIAVFR